MKQITHVFSGALFLCVTNLTCTATLACEPDVLLADDQINFTVSLAAVNRELAECGHDRDCGSGARKLYGMNHIDGIMTVPGDLLILGRIVETKTAQPAESVSALDIDDLVANLRSAMMIYARQVGYHTPVGVTIDMRPDTFKLLQKVSSEINALSDYDQTWPRACSLPMDVKTFSVPHGSSASAKMISIDHWLKHVSNGSAHINNLKSVTERNMDVLLKAARAGTDTGEIGGMTRYWFSTGADDIVEDQGVYFIRKLNVVLLDEAEHLSRNGTFQSTGGVNQAAREFTCEMTAMMGELIESADHPQFKELSDVFRWNAVATLIAEENLFVRSGLWPDWLISDHRLALYDVPDTIEGVSRVYHWPNAQEPDDKKLNVRFVLPSCGGVQIDYRNLPDRILRHASKEVEPIKFAVLESRPNELAEAWSIEVQ
ncbi:hypothetical protein [uncultured Roseobacter sp.]|uniref:hypothetical protein n=1 Tax=uncultured Roseobacter sp. TaxID=114847 RepID=UPI0026272E4D|nr:hypothetical protein [uncultured Roseobacter sp.]